MAAYAPCRYKRNICRELDKFIVNENLTDKHTFTSKEVSKIAKHSKAISEQKFLEYYLPKIDFAIRQAKENFTMDLDELIGRILQQILKWEN